MLFWMIAAVGAGLTVLLVLMPLLGRRATARARAEYDMGIYRDQLAEIDADLARGVLTEAEAEASRTEVSRRLLSAADAAEAEEGARPAPRGATQALTVALALLIVGGGFATYALNGAPGLPDQPRAERLAALEAERADRPSQAEAAALVAGARPERPEAEMSEEELRYRALVAQLEEIVAARPDDLRGHRLLMTSLGRLGRIDEAAAAQARVVEILGAEATGSDHAALVELMVQAAGGYVSPEADAAILAALDVDPNHPVTRYYQGLSMLQAGRPDTAYPIWLRLWREGPAEAPWVRAIGGELAGVARAANMPVPTGLPERPRGPSAADIAAAEDLAPEARAAMIADMVAGLSQRLATEGGPPEDWARLIRAHGVLGDTARARAIWEEARDAFGGVPGAVDLLRDAAREAGVAE